MINRLNLNTDEKQLYIASATLLLSSIILGAIAILLNNINCAILAMCGVILSISLFSYIEINHKLDVMISTTNGKMPND